MHVRLTDHSRGVNAEQAKVAKVQQANAPSTKPSSTKRPGVKTSSPQARSTHARIPLTPTLVEDAQYREFSRRLRVWFKKHGRDLPWRHTRDPYRVLISELMLQQTQVSRVIDKYREFLAKFPTLTHIAESRRSHIVDAWEGLGYYARARNLHKLAKELHENEARGVLPENPEQLRRLPGIGAYTAGAVASFAYEKRASLVDTNVARVLRRVFAPSANPKTTAGNKLIWQIAHEALPKTGKATWIHNQAVMELGALICTARVMHCDRCPVTRVCATRQNTKNEGGV